jgi:pimeloyl-ACP methyl ester carboxylesterase
MAAAILAAAPPRFALAGISMGGYICLEILRQAPQRVIKLALLDTSARPDAPEQIAQRPGALPAWC